MLIRLVLVRFLLECEMYSQQMLIEDVMYLFDQGVDLGRIAEILDCNFDVVDAIVCSCISSDTMELI
jgi:hypothetical protein